jgi:hypothetical protein
MRKRPDYQDEIEVKFDEGCLQIFSQRRSKQLGLPSRLSYGRWTGEGPRTEFFPFMINLEDLKKIESSGRIFKQIDAYTMVGKTPDGGLEIIRTYSTKNENFKGLAKLSKWEYKTIEAFL